MKKVTVKLVMLLDNEKIIHMKGLSNDEIRDGFLETTKEDEEMIAEECTCSVEDV